MAKQINLNADIAEGFGAYDIGNDVELMKIIKSANVACGFHAGDPTPCIASECWRKSRMSASACIRASTISGASDAAAST